MESVQILDQQFKRWRYILALDHDPFAASADLRISTTSFDHYYCLPFMISIETAAHLGLLSAEPLEKAEQAGSNLYEEALLTLEL